MTRAHARDLKNSLARDATVTTAHTRLTLGGTHRARAGGARAMRGEGVDTGERLKSLMCRGVRVFGFALQGLRRVRACVRACPPGIAGEGMTPG